MLSAALWVQNSLSEHPDQPPRCWALSNQAHRLGEFTNEFSRIDTPCWSLYATVWGTRNRMGLNNTPAPSAFGEVIAPSSQAATSESAPWRPQRGNLCFCFFSVFLCCLLRLFFIFKASAECSLCKSAPGLRCHSRKKSATVSHLPSPCHGGHNFKVWPWSQFLSLSQLFQTMVYCS